jgi:hypothetical protein
VNEATVMPVMPATGAPVLSVYVHVPSSNCQPRVPGPP